MLPELPPLFAVTIKRVTEADCVRLPLVPVMVNEYEPVAAVADVDRVSVDDPEPVTEVGLKVPVTPVGRPLTERLTAELNPFKAVTAGVKLVAAPWTTVCVLGEAASEKLGAKLTTSVTGADCVRLPLVPVIVSV